LYGWEGALGFFCEAVGLTALVLRVLLKAKDNRISGITLGTTGHGLLFHLGVEFVNKTAGQLKDTKA
jgi:hypothetical protein